MKYTFLITVTLLTLTSMLFASHARSQNLEKKISLRLEQSTIKESLLAVEKKANIRFALPDELLSKTTDKVSIHAGEISVRKAIDLILDKTDLTYRVLNNFVVIETKPAPKTEPKQQQNGRISGKVVDDRGEPLPGASVKIVQTNQAVQSSVDGTYNFSLTPGSYTIEVSFLSFQTKRITQVEVKAGQTTSLNIVLNPATNELSQVVVTGNFKKESVAGLYAEQKNRASMSDGISAEQIARTPDNNVGTVLKRVSGINTIDNKYVVVRGMAERYNQSMVDGISVPSTDLNRRNFSFDVVPAELVSNVVVNKTATPDQSSEFSGGQVIVNTLAIPQSNFTSISLGTGFNSQSTGKDMTVIGGRGKYDYIGFDDGERKSPGSIEYWVFPKSGIGNDNPTDYEPTALEQSKRFNPNGFKLYNQAAKPNQNYRLTIGRVYDLNENHKIGFVAGVTYRNTQEINNYRSNRGLDYLGTNVDSDTSSVGKMSKFNSTWGATVNGGWQNQSHKLGIRNIYTRMLSDESYDVYKRQNDMLEIKQRNLFADPIFTDILQNKLEGEHKLTERGLMFSWSAARTSVSQEHKDLRNFTYNLTATVDGQDIYQSPVLANTNRLGTGFNFDYRVWTTVKQIDYNWAANLSHPFNFLNDKSLVKIGYAGWDKNREQGTLLANLYSAYTGKFFDLADPYEIVLAPENQGWGQDKGYYFANAENSGDQYKGNSKYHAYYAMLDQRFFQKLRLVYGLRAENFNSRNRQLAEIERRRRFEEMYPDVSYSGPAPEETGEKNWNFLPSINLTYSLTDQMNIRAAYAKTMIRPDLRETSVMAFVDPLLRGEISGGNLASTKINNYDLRYEWYPQTGEIISVSGFYKDFKDPVELYKSPDLDKYYFGNSKSAVNYGLEAEIRKSLGFVADKQWLRNLTLFGNATIMRSEVTTEGDKEVDLPEGGTEWQKYENKIKRPLFGQSPYIVNAGITYDSRYFGLNAVFNRSGYRAYTVQFEPGSVEYELGRNVIDLQLSTRLLKQKLEIRLNISNLLDNAAIYYINAGGYELDEDDNGKRWEYVARPGQSDNYSKSDEGDRVTHRVKYGRTGNISFTYNF
ncbi:TonB-dependent receptor [Sphingobacterium thalpophilum]|uniref:TonB-dependent receptor n=2 Tax=Sphingobacterium TaxID=28453 RepID=UPI002D779222|nr:TonB-dependent receptor [Sphingobacterium thalpophilum]